MKQTLIWMTCMVAAAPAIAQVKAKASLQAVTVYAAAAEMMHTFKADIPAGSSELVIDHVANHIDESSVRLGANANITIMSIRVARNYLTEEKQSPEQKRLDDSIKIIRKQIAGVDTRLSVEQGVIALLEENTKVAGANNGLNVTELGKLADYYKTKKLEANEQIVSLNEQRDKYNERLMQLQKQFDELKPEESAAGQLVVQLMAKNAANTEFDLSYVTGGAYWTPYYDLRANNTTDPLQLAYKANVVQNTGVDWKKVNLTLSTSNPSVSSTAPSLSTWFLKYGSVAKQYQAGRGDQNTYKSNVIQSMDKYAPGVAITSGGGQPWANADTLMGRARYGGAKGTPLIVVDGAIFSGSMSDIDPDDIETMSVVKDATAKSLYGARGANEVIMITSKSKNASDYVVAMENDLNASFDISIPYDIVSNNKPHSVLLQEYKLPVQYKYYAVPKADPDAFLLAELTGYDKLNLLPGEANIIFNDMYVGKSFISPGGMTDTLNLSMGRDKKIVVKRERVADKTGTRFLGSNKKHTLTYDITVRNGKKEAVNLLLKDQYPVATDKDMEIELLESADAMVNTETGVLTWKLQLAAGESKKVRISYSVTYPKGKSIANW